MSDIIVVALIAAIASITTAIISAAALVQSRRTYLSVNSRMDELLQLARFEARAEGYAAAEKAFNREKNE